MALKDDLLDITPDDFPIRTLQPLQSKDLVVAEAVRVQFHCYLQPGQTLDDALTPDFYRLCSHRLMPGALIEIQPLDGSFWALVLVRECSREHARVALLQKVDLPPLYGPAIDSIPLGHSVQYLGVSRQWACMRGTQILKTGFSTKGDAIGWLQTAL